MSRDFVEGRGAQFTHPVRLFVLAGALAFLATQASWGLLFRLSLSLAAAGFGDQWAVLAMLLVAVPATALLFRLLFAKPHRLYLAHLVFAIHLFSFILLLSAFESLVGALAGEFTTSNWIPGVSALVIVFSYSVIAMRTFYRDSWWRLVTKGLAILLVYLMTLGWLANALL